MNKTGISKQIVGRTIWGQATSEQKSRIENEIITMIIKDYSKAMQYYCIDEKFIIQPIRCSQQNLSTYNIQTQLRRKNGQKIKIGYHFKKQDQWLLNNLCIDRICIANSYRSQLASLKAKNPEQMISILKKHNHTNE